MLFSSAAGVLGSAGQGNYAAANAFLDALAAAPPRRRAARHLAGLGPVGASQRHDRRPGRGRPGPAGAAPGSAPLPPSEGLALFDAALARRTSRCWCRSGSTWPRCGPQARTGRCRPLLRGLVRAPARRRRGRRGSLRRSALAGAAPSRERRAASCSTLVRAQVAAVLGHAVADAVDPTAAFQDLGFDSLTAVELRNRLDQATGLRLPATLVFDHPTASAVAAYLLTRSRDRAGRSTPTASSTRSPPSLAQ